MAECEHLARTSAYYDGALAVSDEAGATDHIATCAECQALLGDAVGIDAALGDAKPRARRRRWPLIVGFLAVAASVVLWLALRGREVTTAVVAMELPRERAVEARFTGERFAPHRTLAVLRGDTAREQIPLATMAALEKAGKQHDLVAALAASGDTARATELAEKLPATPAGDADRAAVALAAGEPERALKFAWRAVDRDPDLVIAHWNVAIAARALGLPRVARTELERVAKAAEPGWADEAKRAVDAIELPDERAADIDRRGKDMLAGGAVLSADDVSRAPSQVRIDFLDAVRVAADKARLDALRPLANALDGASGTTHAIAFLDRADPALGAKYGAAYRALVARTSTPEQTKQLLDELHAQPRAAYLYVGAVVLANQARARWVELAKLTAPWNDPWFTLAIERERLFATLPENDPRLEPALAALLAQCKNDAWAMRCGQIALDLANVLRANGRQENALPIAEQAVEYFARAGKPLLRVRAKSFVAELHRRLGRTALARTEHEEVVLSSASSCDNRRYARIGQASIALLDGDWAAARALLPPAEREHGCTQQHDLVGMGIAVDLARASGDPKDVEAARKWLAQAAGDFKTIGEARLLRGAPEAGTALDAWFAATENAPADPLHEAARTWATTTRIADAGARAGWDEVIAFAERDTPALRTATCSVVASADDASLTVVVKTDRALSGAHRTIVPAELASTVIVPQDLVTQLAGCKDISVVARPPLHGRADLLPAELPWAFASAAATVVPPTAGRTVVVGDARAPDPSLPRLAPPPTTGFDVAVVGNDATPQRVLAALADATYAELHVHGIVDAEGDAAHLVLSPGADGAYALRAAAVRTAKLKAAPLVVLGACRAASVAPYYRERWSLPDAFLVAGARAVVAADTPIEDTSGQAVFAELRRRALAGEPITAVVAAIRAASPADSWARRLVVFR